MKQRENCEIQPSIGQVVIIRVLCWRTSSPNASEYCLTVCCHASIYLKNNFKLDHSEATSLIMVCCIQDVMGKVETGFESTMEFSGKSRVHLKTPSCNIFFREGLQFNRQFQNRGTAKIGFHPNHANQGR